MLIVKGVAMEDQNFKLIAMLPDTTPTTPATDIQQVLEQHLRQKLEFQQQRFQLALKYSVTATLGVFVALVVAFGLNFFGTIQFPDQFHLYADFAEWRSTTQYPVCSWECEFPTQALRLVLAAADIGGSILSNEAGYGSVAGIARLCTLISVSVAVWCTYRKLLAEYYAINGQPAQLEDFQNTLPCQFWLSRILFTAASLFGAYVVVSLAWLGLSVTFKALTLDRFNASLIIVAFTGTVTFAAAYMALAASTRVVLMLGLFTFFFGFSASFALSPLIQGRQWWASAVSNAGQLNPSAPLFTGTLLSGSMALWMLWYDLDSIIEKMIADGDVRFLSSQAWMRVAGVLYAGLIIGLISVGFVRVDDANFPSNKIFHAGGAVLAIASVVISGLLIRKNRFHPWYKVFSVHILLGVTLGIALLGSIRLDPLALVFPGTGLISLTVIELVLFILIGMWVYFTVENLLAQANIQGFSGRVIMVTEQDTATPNPQEPP